MAYGNRKRRLGGLDWRPTEASERNPQAQTFLKLHLSRILSSSTFLKNLSFLGISDKSDKYERILSGEATGENSSKGNFSLPNGEFRYHRF